MKRILLAVLLLTATSAWAEWVNLGSAGGGEIDFYADPATIRKAGDKVKMWRLYDFKAEQVVSGKRYLSAKGQEEFDCKDESARTIAFIWHAGQMGGGDVVYTGRTPQDWQPVAPGSINVILWKFACGKK